MQLDQLDQTFTLLGQTFLLRKLQEQNILRFLHLFLFVFQRNQLFFNLLPFIIEQIDYLSQLQLSFSVLFVKYYLLEFLTILSAKGEGFLSHK